MPQVILPSVDDVKSGLQTFKWWDYTTCAIGLLVCVSPGLWIGFFRELNDSRDYLIGDRKMSIFAVTLALITSCINGLTLLAIPIEIYLGGMHSICQGMGYLIITIIVVYGYLPVFYRLNLISIYEYLEKRFSKKVRILGALLFIINMILILPAIMYIPVSAFRQALGENVSLITTLLCLVSIFFTSLGGIRAVLWTNTLQVILIFTAISLLLVKSTIETNPLETINEHFNAPSLDMVAFKSYALLGGFLYHLYTSAVNQNVMQKYLSLPSLKSAKQAAWSATLGACFLVFLSACCGFLMSVYFYRCDPLSTELVEAKEAMLPFFVGKVFNNWPGMAGVFGAGLWGASLSFFSTGLNALACVIHEDFFRSFFSEKGSLLLMKLTVLFFGTLSIFLVHFLHHQVLILQISTFVKSVTTGSLLGMFTMGIFFPWVNSKGAFSGGIASCIVTFWLVFDTRWDLSEEKTLSTEDCPYHFVPQPHQVNATDFLAGDIYSMPNIYFWYTLLGTFVCVIVGLLVSFVTKPLDPRDVDPRLLAPCLRRIIKPREYPNQPGEGIIYAYCSK